MMRARNEKKRAEKAAKAKAEAEKQMQATGEDYDPDAAHNKRTKLYRESLIARGLCTMCRGPLEEGTKFQTCAACREKKRIYQRREQEKQREKRKPQKPNTEPKREDYIGADGRVLKRRYDIINDMIGRGCTDEELMARFEYMDKDVCNCYRMVRAGTDYKINTGEGCDGMNIEMLMAALYGE